MLYILDNWPTFTASHFMLEDSARAMHKQYVGKSKTLLLLSSRKRKHNHLTQPIGVVLPDSQVQHDHKTCPTAQSLVPYDLTDSSDSEEENSSANKPILQYTMSCMIRLRMAMERMLDKQIILNPQAPVELLNVMEKVETLYESTD